MKAIFAGAALLGLAAGLGSIYVGGEGSVFAGSDYEPSKFYEKCDRDYLQSAPHLGFRASSSECECFDAALQKLTPSQQSAAYKTLEDRLTLAFMGKAGAKVRGNNVSFHDKGLGQVNAELTVETSGNAIMQRCEMF
ncbi:MAG: hypothetical protein ABJP34_13495 [Erythrobacter sp.]